jgi:D-psicose/D-tagatose/L-ribulose 3-epimerase
MYDTFHANIEEKDPIAAIETVFRSGKLNHVHISENDRGTPGRGHINIPAAIKKLKSLGYDGWMTIEAFGGALPDLAAATRVWRDFFPSTKQVYEEGYALIRKSWGSTKSAPAKANKAAAAKKKSKPAAKKGKKR